MTYLSGKKIVVMGVANKKSIAWGCAEAMETQGAEVIYTYQNDRMKKSLQKIVSEDAFLVECDVASDESIQSAFSQIKDYAGEIDGIVHAIAYAKKEELSGNVTDISRDGYALAQDISSYSLIAVSKYGQEILSENSGIVSLTYIGSERAIPNYNMMGIAKASLEASIRYLAAELSPKKIRVNGISAGAIKTLAVTGVQDYQKLIQLSEDRTPDHIGVTIEEVGNTCAFLISPLSSGIIGDVIYVDKGVHLS
ncbi:enoyl-ACP reductase [Enterococcus phoeniculicola]|jgi:enoyl-[acyl-carrier protein] reductase I|uniref:Enoyl-[acyl-carrier-protein] reductase [NADH] n=1 Tax=Enterococcus phoeniculicola ATCC BAA-412 TaxID=1158610 RepID=R3WF91_9ENTE|nr:enoyl-ACP reductase FabI [Enterococcus phoeniculicola]EOL46132.1 enoyl-ACP reductase [Enterococcus phoeniculicola ATCC BAA-412]EOT77023.1 enoyl-ACP reductase [Enterococcus phoeniculicola ATCC BAA-412]OJG73362.1 enoyl-ACP reductase [Enterococcus phoeniculicola]